ncbi:MAG TPA: tetratricopeptide repeat protein [Vicinamibacterales bacterium]|nr:tetratricopeptide repeat protein [Vicinamibacterales bacterium]
MAPLALSTHASSGFKSIAGPRRPARQRWAESPALRILIAAAMVAVVLIASHQAALGGQQSAADARVRAVGEARKLIDAGQPEAAIEKLRAMNDSDPRVTELLGVAYYHANDPARAIEQLSSVVDRLAPDSLERREAVQVLGLSHYLAGHLAQAIPFLEETRPLVPNDVKLAYALGMAYAQTRQPAKARDAFARAFGVPPDSAAAHLLAGQMMNRLELEDLAEAELKEALRLDPKIPEAHYLLGQIAIFRSRLDEGLALMREELRLNPAHAMAQYRIGDIYSRQGKWEMAIAALQQSIWMNPYYSGPYILLGKAYMKAGQPGAAETMLRRAIEYDPNNKSAHYLLAQLLQQTGRTEDAKREFAIAERLQGDTPK